MNEPYYIENSIQKFLKETKSKYEGKEAEFDEIINEKLAASIENIARSTLEEIYNIVLVMLVI